MSMTSSEVIELSDVQRPELARLVRAGRTEQRLALRASIVLHAGQGQSTATIAARLGVCEDTARKWRHRWCASPGVDSLRDAHRSGRPPLFSPVQVAQVKALACRPPAHCSAPLSHWSCPELARQVITDGICESISGSTVRRWPAMRSNLGSISRGYSFPTLTSRPKPGGSWTSTPASGTANR